jgi:hypothetical protein
MGKTQILLLYYYRTEVNGRSRRRETALQIAVKKVLLNSEVLHRGADEGGAL